MHHVTIVGGGFSGVLTAVQVMRECKQTVFIFLVNKDFPVARGAAYSTESSSHLLNVRACNMSAFPDDQDHLVKWLSGQAGYAQYSPEKISELFIPRKVYGNYLDEVFNIERVKFHLMGRGRLTLLNKEATGLRKTTEGYAVSFSDETELFTHQVILATGNTAPYLPVELETIRQHARYIAEPWKRFPTTFLNDNTADVFILGSGLSMVDAFISLEDAGWKGTVYTTSQHGLFPAKHHQLNTRRQLVEQDFLHCTLQEAVNIYRQLAEQAAAEGSDPLLVLDQLRPVTQYLWKHFSAKDKRRFLYFFKSKWNVARHKIAESIHGRMEAALSRRQLKLLPGKVAHIETGRNYFVIKVKHAEQVRYFTARYVINCSGPLESLSSNTTPLWKNLLQQSLIQPDGMGMGPSVNDQLQTINRFGEVNTGLFAIGPVVRGTFWECMAVPEIRVQARVVAAHILKNMETEKATPAPVSVPV